MSLMINQINNSEQWNSFVSEHDFVNIVSSWEWIEFEKELGFETQAYSVLDKYVFAFRKVYSKKGKYLLLKQNCFLDWSDEKTIKEVLFFLKQKCKERNCSFFRLSPPLLFKQESFELFKDYGFKKSIISATEGQLTVILDLTKSFEELLNDMRKNTRYLVKKGEKMKVEVLNTDGLEFLGDFEKIYVKTQRRNKWNGFDFEHIKNQYVFFSEKGLSRMFVAKYEGEVLASAVFTVFNNQVIYHHSGSITSDVPVMYSLMWEAVKYYKALGIKEFNFFGVCKKEDTKHSWYGLSLFKRGFGGKERELMCSFDYPVNRCRFYAFRFLESLVS